VPPEEGSGATPELFAVVYGERKRLAHGQLARAMRQVLMELRLGTRPLHLAVLLLLLGPWPRPATGQLLGPEFQVNGFTTQSQHRPAVAADGSGNFVVVWQSFGQDGPDRGVFGQRFDSAGNPVGSEFQVNSYTTGDQWHPAVAASALGNFVVVWQSVDQDGSSSGAFGQRFDFLGNPVGSEFQVNSYTTSYQGRPALAAGASGNFVVVWQSFQDGSYRGVFGQRFDFVGNPVGSEFQVNSYTTGYQYRPAVAADAAGNFVVVWQSGVLVVSSRGVFGQRFDSAGNPVGSEFQVNSYTSNAQRYPAVAVEGSGNFVVVWESAGQDGSSYGVFGQTFDLLGNPVGSEFQVNSHTTDSQQLPAVAADTSVLGNFVVVWNSNGPDGSYDGVFGQRFDPAGLPLGGEFQVNSYTTYGQYDPAVAAHGSDTFVMVWSSSSQDGSLTGVFGQRYGSTGPIFTDGFEAGDACSWSTAVGGGCP